MARLNIITTIYPDGTGRPKPIAYDERPDWMRNWEQTGLLAFEDKNGDGRSSTTTRQPGLRRHRRGARLGRQRDGDLQPGHPGAGQPRDRAASGLGDRADRRRRSGGGAVDGGGPAAGHLLGDQSRPDQVGDQPRISEKGELLAARISMGFAIALATYWGSIRRASPRRWWRWPSVWPPPRCSRRS
jgi:cation/acetate symporter